MFTISFALKPTGGAGLYTSAMDRIILSASKRIRVNYITTPNYVATGMIVIGIALENWSKWIRGETRTLMQAGSPKELKDTRHGRTN